MIRHLFRWPTLLVATAMHYVWAIILLTDPRVIHVTALTPAANFNPRLVGLLLLFIAHFGVWALTQPRLSWKTLFALLPQQMVLLMSSIAAVFFAVAGHYGDGVARPHGFIMADQALIVLMTMMHTVVLVAVHRPVVGGHRQTSPELPQPILETEKP